jgi:hypothetical protein
VEDDLFGLLAPERDRPTPLVQLAPEQTLHLSAGARWPARFTPKPAAPGVGWLAECCVHAEGALA